MPRDADSDPFKPPAIPTEVGCLHCGKTFESYLIEWRISTGADGKERGFWCCPTPGCDGRGFGFDLLPTDPEYRDENGESFFTDDEDGDSDDDSDEFDLFDDDSDDCMDDLIDKEFDGGPPSDRLNPPASEDDSDHPW
jgi:hypothetical protein